MPKGSKVPPVLPKANPAAAREESEGGLTANMEMLSRADSTEQQEENVIHGTTELIVDEKIEEIHFLLLPRFW